MDQFIVMSINGPQVIKTIYLKKIYTLTKSVFYCVEWIFKCTKANKNYIGSHILRQSYKKVFVIQCSK